MRKLLLILLCAFTVPASAADHGKFYGIWGTPKQCSNAPLKEGGTVLALPFEIGSTWLKQGQLWCSLKWGPIEKRKDELFTAANAQCGEDSVRGYFLRLKLSDEKLTLLWDFPVSNGPLMRCKPL